MSEVLYRYSEKDFEIEHKLTNLPHNDHLMHTHDTIEILYFISGDCYYLVEGTKYRLKTGDIMIMRPLETHHLVVCSSKVPYERIVANIHPDLLGLFDPESEILTHLLNRPLGNLNRFDSTVFSHTLCSESFSMIATLGRHMNRIDLLSRILLVLSEAERVAKRLNPELKKDNTGDRLIDYVNQNLFKEISLKRLSEVFFLSESQVNRIFKKNTGSSVKQYISAKRLLTARNRIRAGEPSVKVSEDCGYNDYSTFYRSYYSRFGCSPQEDRKA